ncbi:melatonin receptor type 1C-like [Branchiostoma floridae x Branchiostoma belcheri]|nr:hypothetical protein Bbelb_294840 [Branchiostoma belcheri]
MNNTTVNESCLLPDGDQPTGLTAPMRYFLAAALLLASFVGVVGNSMVIAANVMEKKIRSSTNFFLANMATADLMTSLICDSCLSLAWFYPAFKPSCVFRDVMGFVYFFSVDLSVLNSGLVAWNRYVLITKPLQTYNMLFTPTKITIYCITSWISTFLMILLVFAYFRRLARPSYILISVPAADMSDMVFFVVNIIEIIILVVAPILLSLFFYIAIFLKIRKVKERVKAHAAPNPNAKKLYRPSRKVVREITSYLFVLFLVLLVCSTPISITQYVHVLVTPVHPDIQNLTLVLAMINSSINPIIHTIKSQDYRNVFKKIIRSGCLND